jgi:hypothetical protein
MCNIKLPPNEREERALGAEIRSIYERSNLALKTIARYIRGKNFHRQRPHPVEKISLRLTRLFRIIRLSLFAVKVKLGKLETESEWLA